MILNLILGVVAGLLVPRGERWLRAWAESLWMGRPPLDEREFDMAALLVILIVTSVVLAMLGAESSAFLLCLGALVGLFGKRIWARIQSGERR